MITVRFLVKNGEYTGFSIAGHADNRVICANITSAAQLTVNAAERGFGCNADRRVADGKLFFSLKSADKNVSVLIGSLAEHIALIADNKNVKIKYIGE